MLPLWAARVDLMRRRGGWRWLGALLTLAPAKLSNMLEALSSLGASTPHKLFGLLLKSDATSSR